VGGCWEPNSDGLTHEGRRGKKPKRGRPENQESGSGPLGANGRKRREIKCFLLEPCVELRKRGGENGEGVKGFPKNNARAEQKKRRRETETRFMSPATPPTG